MEGRRWVLDTFDRDLLLLHAPHLPSLDLGRRVLHMIIWSRDILKPWSQCPFQCRLSSTIHGHAHARSPQNCLSCLYFYLYIVVSRTMPGLEPTFY
jgi:hypothetical protein